MALTVVKRPLGFQSDGLPKLIGTTSTASALTHTAPSSTSVFEEIYLFAFLDNTKTAAITMTMVINSQSYTSDVLVGAIEQPLLTGLRLQGQASASNGNRIEIFASSTAGVFLTGYVNRVTES